MHMEEALNTFSALPGSDILNMLGLYKGEFDLSLSKS